MKVPIGVSTGKKISLTQQIASSGEGAVWQTDRSGYLAKIYHASENERVEKLKVMVARPPQEPNAHLNHVSFAWPEELLKDSKGSIVGFLMPAIAGAKELVDVYSLKRRRQLNLEADWRFLHITALNIAAIIEAIHAEGYVLGDIKPQNILVNSRALPSIIDTDSFQVRHPSTSRVYRCLVGSEGFTPVELLGKDFRTTNQTEVHDYFRLAVIVHLLLFGDKPFKGKWMGAGESPDPVELLRRGFWPYAPNSPIQPGPHTIPLDIVHPQIQQCFLKCFNDGHTKPDLRPTAKEWRKALSIAVENLTVCGKVDSHYYSTTYGQCYWCDRKAQKGLDLFEPLAPKREQPSSSRLAPPSAISAAKIRQLIAASAPPVAPPPSRVSSSKSRKPVVTSPSSEPVAIIRWAVGMGLAMGGVLWLIRAILGSAAQTLNEWVLYYPPEVTHFPFTRIPPENLFNVVEAVQWVCGGFGVFAIAIIIVVIYWRR